MADISNVHIGEIKDISDSLEALSCKFEQVLDGIGMLMKIARILTRVLY
jgi:hypothetical protein